MSYTLSQIQADFDAGSAHLKDSASPYLEFHFGSGVADQVYKSTMVKGGGAKVAWQQPVLLTGASSTRLRIEAKAHKTLLSDKTIDSGILDLGTSAAEGGFTTVPLTSLTGKPAGVVRFVVSQGQAPGAAGIRQPAAGANGVVDGVGGPGHNVEGALAPPMGGQAAGYGGQQGVGGQQGMVGGQQGYNSGAPGIGGQQGIVGGQQGYNHGAPGIGGQQGGVYQDPNQQQLAPMGQQGMQTAQPGSVGGGFGAGGNGGLGGRPQEFHEKRSHNVSDHSENETSEVRHIG